MSRPALARRAVLTEIADAQDGVVTRRQLAELGYNRDAVRAQIAARRWQPAGPRVIVLHNGPMTVAQRRWSAVLSQHNSALAGLTAAAEQGLTGFDDDAVHLLVPFGTRIAASDGVRIHVSRRFSTDDIHPARRIPTVRLERALVDGASWTP